MSRRSPLGSWVLGSGSETGKRLRVRVQILLTGSVILANSIGILVVAALLFLVLPGPSVLTKELAMVNFVYVPLYCMASLVIGLVWGTSWMFHSLRWALDDAEATRRDRIRTLRLPWKLTIVSGSLWAVGTVAVTLVYGLVNPELIARTIFTMVIGGIVVSANSYLLTEFSLRPVAARALASSPPRRAVGVGIVTRAMVLWFLAALPVVGLMIVALFAMLQGDVSSNRIAVTNLALGGVALVFGFLLTWMNTRSLVAPIRTVSEAMKRVQRGKLDTSVVVFDGTELGILQSGFNEMVTDVREREHIRDLFGRHVGKDVAAAALANDLELGGEVRDVAVLFIDLVGSTELASKRPPAEVVDLLNKFFGVVVQEVDEHGGFVNKFEGDAALAIFGAPEDLPDAAGRALAAARAMSTRLAEEVPEAKAGIGVSAGEAVAGNVGAHDRFEYTVIGDPVNEAARLTEQAKKVDGRVVASKRALDAASEDESQHWEELHEVQLRGRSEPTMLVTPK